MNFDATVRKIVRTETDVGVTYQVLLASAEGHRVTLCFDDEAQTRGFAPDHRVQVEVKNPQQTLDSEKRGE